MRALWLLVLCLLGAHAFAQAPPGAWWNAGYQYRQQISVPAGASPLQASYSVSFVFDHASHVNASPARSLASGNDVRIVRWNSASSSWVELDRILDPDTAWNTNTTRLWFRTTAAIAQGATDLNYYVYFNNSAAGLPPQNADNVFLLYDDFSSGSISNTRWSANNGVQADNSGAMRLTTNSNVQSLQSFSYDTIWETRARMTDAYGNYLFWGGSANLGVAFPLLRFEADSNSYQALARDWLWTDTRTVAPVNPIAYQKYSFTREGSSIARFYINDAQVAAFTANEPPVSDLRVDLRNSETGEQIYYDWARIRTYRNPEPVPILGALTPNNPGPDHFLIAHDRSGINCAAEPVTVSVRDSNNALVPTYTQPMTLDTGTGRGTWSLVSGGGTLADTTPNDGIATYVWPGNQSTAVFALSYPEGRSTFDIDVFQSSSPALRDNDAEGTITFSPSAFVLTSSPLATNQDPPFPMMSAQSSGASFNVHIAKVGSTASGATCRVVTDYAGAKTLRVWSDYENPSSGTRSVSLTSGTTTSIATSLADGVTTMSVTFNAGRAVVAARYPDAGRVRVNVRDQYEATLPTPVLTQGSASVVVRPNLVVSNIRQGGTTNPAATSADDPRFIAAGSTFTADISAVTVDSPVIVTPNFGRETPAESIKLVPHLVAPSGGATPPIASATTPVFVNGVATGAGFSWPEVGIIRLTAQIADESYLESGDVVGSMTGTVGRFIPASFGATANWPIFQTGCPAGTFTYVGQRFPYLIAPVVTVTALAAGGTTTTNYRDDFFKLTGGAAVNRTYLPAGSLDLTGLPGASADAVLVKGQGTGTLTFGSGTGIAYSRSTPVAPFTANVSLAITILDSDDVAYPSNPFVIDGGGSGIAFSNGAEQLYGRITLRNQVGSELIHLQGKMHAEFFGANGFQLNTRDACTSGVTLQLSGPIASNTCVINGGTCVPGAPLAQRFRSTPTALPPGPGDFNLWLRAPGAGNHGSVTVTADVPSWLKYDWNVDPMSPLVLENPSANFVFGIFPGVSPHRIYQREAIVR